MAGITHTPVAGTAEGSDPTKIRKSNWEADHNIADGTITLAMLAFDVATQVELNALSASLGSAAFTSAGAYEVPLTFSTGLTRIGNTITASGGGGSGTVTSVGLVGTANQLTVTGSSPITGSGSWTLSIPGSAQLSIAKLTNLTSNGLVTTSGGDGTLSVTGTSGSGNVVLVTSATLVTPTLGVASATSLALSGTAGAGFITLLTQSSPPSAPASGYREYADSSGRRSWIRASDGFIRTWDAVLTADRVYTLPDATTTIAGLAVAQSFTAAQTIAIGANATALTVTGYSVTSTGTSSLASFAGTLNGTGIVDVLKLSVTNTATNAASKLLNLYAGASGTTSVFSVGMDGSGTYSGRQTYPTTTGASNYRNLGVVQLQTNPVGAAQAPGFAIEDYTGGSGTGGIIVYTYYQGAFDFYNRPTTGNIASTDLIYRLDASRNFVFDPNANGYLMKFGGATSSFPALKRSTTSLEVKLADDSAYAGVKLLNLLVQSGGSVDLSAIAAGSPNLVVTKTTDTPTTTFNVVGTNNASAAPIGYVELTVAGVGAGYLAIYA